MEAARWDDFLRTSVNGLKRFIRLGLLFIWFCLSMSDLFAQDNAAVKDTVESGEIEILFQRKLRTVIKDGREVNYFQGDVVFKHDDVFIFCDTGTKEDKIIRAWGNVVIKQGDTLNIFSDKLYYDGNTKIADLERNVVLEKRNQKLFTRKLRYDVSTKIATYNVGATLTDDKTYLRSKRGIFYAKTNDALFKDSVVVLDPEFSLKTDTLLYNTESKRATFLAPTLISYENSRIYTEAGYYLVDERYAKFTKNPQYLSENQRSKSDTMYYIGSESKVRLLRNAKFEEDDKVAKADTIDFFEDRDLVDLIGNARYRETNRTASGERFIYNRQTGTFKSPKRISISEPPQILEADSLDFVDETGLGIAIGMVHWQDTSQNMQIFCETVHYNKKEDYLKAWGGRPVLGVQMDGDWLWASGDTLLRYAIHKDSLAKRAPAIDPEVDDLDSLLVELDVFALDSLADLSEAVLEAELPKQETKEVLTATSSVKSDSLKTHQIGEKTKEKKLKTTGKGEKKRLTEKSLELLFEHEPILESDTAFVGFEQLSDSTGNQIEEISDSLLVGPFIPDSLLLIPAPFKSDTIKFMLLYNDVRIYKQDMRGLCDSLVFNTLDSIFTFYRDPFMWSDSTQFTGDTIQLIMKNKKLNRMDLLSNALVISTPNEVYFDQIRGKLINAFFMDGAIDNVLVTGNAETVYYVTDKDGAYNGVNAKQSSKMRIFFKEKQMQNIRFYTSPDGKFIPMGKADHEGMRLKGFQWSIDERPETPESITDLAWIPWDILIPMPSDEEDDSEEGELNEGEEGEHEEVGSLLEVGELDGNKADGPLPLLPVSSSIKAKNDNE